MKKYWKSYFIAVIFTVVCAYFPWALLSWSIFSIKDTLIYSLFFAILALPASLLYWLRQGVPRKLRVLFFFLNPALYYLIYAGLIFINISGPDGFNPGPGI